MSEAEVGRNPDLHPFADADLIQELRFRGVLNAERKVEEAPGGLEVWVLYWTQWMVEDEVYVGDSGGLG